MKSLQAGFTLIELVIVIVILGVLAAVAVPQFVNLEPEARRAALQGMAGALNSAYAVNYAACKAAPGTGKGTAVDNCDDGNTILQSALPAGYTLNTGAVLGDGATEGCQVTDTNVTPNIQEPYTAIGATGC